MEDIEKLKKLRDLAVSDKDAFLELLKKNPEVWQSLIQEDRRNKLIEAARTETPEGSATTEWSEHCASVGSVIIHPLLSAASGAWCQERGKVRCAQVTPLK